MPTVFKTAKLLSATGLLAVTCAAQAVTVNEIVSDGYGYTVPSAVSSGQITTLAVKGVTVADADAMVVPLPTSLSGLAVSVKSNIPGYPTYLPLLHLRSFDFCSGRYGVSCPLTYVKVQIPSEPTCVGANADPQGCGEVESVTIFLNVSVNGTPGENFAVTVNRSQPHFLNTCDLIFGSGGDSCYPLMTHGDGSPLSDGALATPGTIATAGETIVLYAVGLGPTTPPVSSGMGSPNPAATIDPLNFPLVFSYQIVFPNTASVPPVLWSPVPRLIYPTYIGLVPNYVGLYQINVVVPEELGQLVLPVYNVTCPVNARIAIGTGQDNSSPIDGASFINLCINE